MENIEENQVTAGAAKADPMPASGVPVEDLGGPTPENYKPDDDSAKLKDPSATLAQVKDIVNAKAAKADAMAGTKAEDAQPEGDVIGIGSGGNYALAAGKVLMEGDMSAEEVAKKAIKVAADICVFTNDNVKIEKI